MAKRFKISTFYISIYLGLLHGRFQHRISGQIGEDSFTRSQEMGAFRILIADDHEVVRRGIRALIESHPGWEVCADAVDGREAVERARELKPDLVLLTSECRISTGWRQRGRFLPIAR